MLTVYEAAFRQLDYGYASAIAYVVFILSGLFSIFVVKRFRPRFGAGAATG